MAVFTGTSLNETITPLFVSPTVVRFPAGRFPGMATDRLCGGGGADRSYSGGGDDDIHAMIGPDVADGGSGTDTVDLIPGDTDAGCDGPL